MGCKYHFVSQLEDQYLVVGNLNTSLKVNAVGLLASFPVVISP